MLACRDFGTCCWAFYDAIPTTIFLRRPSHPFAEVLVQHQQSILSSSAFDPKKRKVMSLAFVFGEVQLRIFFQGSGVQRAWLGKF